jgi:hypothetical protein
MRLKKLYTPLSLSRFYKGEIQHHELEVMGIELERAGPRQHFTPDFLMRGVQEKWIDMDISYVTIKSMDAKGENLKEYKYKILRPPGEYYVDGVKEVVHYFDCAMLPGTVLPGRDGQVVGD